MSVRITLKPMLKKELAALIGVSRDVLRRMLAAHATAHKDFGEWAGARKLSKKQVRQFLEKGDYLSEEVEIEPC